MGRKKFPPGYLMSLIFDEPIRSEQINKALEITSFDIDDIGQAEMSAEECHRLWQLGTNVAAAIAAGARVTPQVVLQNREVVGHLPDGPIGYCIVELPASHFFAKWLLKSKHAYKYGRERIVSFIVPESSGSAERAAAFGLSLARTLRRAGVPVLRVVPRLD